jgi:hypothetical protein
LASRGRPAVYHNDAGSVYRSFHEPGASRIAYKDFQRPQGRPLGRLDSLIIFAASHCFVEVSAGERKPCAAWGSLFQLNWCPALTVDYAPLAGEWISAPAES